MQLIQDQCPHRGIALSIGQVVNDEIACAYHGVRVNGKGVVTAVPALPECKLVGRKLTRSYPVAEHFQGVWAYFGEVVDDPPPLHLPEELLSPEWSGYLVSTTWKINHHYVLDNLGDPLHTRYLHEHSYSMGIDSQSDLVDVQERPNGFRVRRRNDPSNVDEMDFVDDSCIYVRVGISLPPALGPGGLLRIITTVVPIDGDNTQINFWRLRRTSAWEAAMWRFMFNMKYEAFAWEVLEQDRVALEAMPPWPAPENLYQHDAGLVRIRRHMRAEAAKELEPK